MHKVFLIIVFIFCSMRCLASSLYAISFEKNGKKFGAWIVLSDVVNRSLQNEGSESSRLVLKTLITSDNAVIDSILNNAKEWLLRHYINEGTFDSVKDKGLIDEFQTTERLNDGRSSFTIIFDLSDATKIWSMFRMSHPTRDEKLLPSLKRLAAEGIPLNLAMPKLEYLENASVKMCQIDSSGARNANQTVVVPIIKGGGALEFKNFGHDKSLGIDFLPDLFFIGDLYGMTRYSYNPNDPESPNEFKVNTLATEVVAETRLELRSYYEQKGMRFVTEFIDQQYASTKLQILDLDRANLENIFIPSYLFRKGNTGFLEALNLDPSMDLLQNTMGCGHMRSSTLLLLAK